MAMKLQGASLGKDKDKDKYKDKDSPLTDRPISDTISELGKKANIWQWNNKGPHLRKRQRQRQIQWAREEGQANI